MSESFIPSEFEEEHTIGSKGGRKGDGGELDGREEAMSEVEAHIERSLFPFPPSATLSSTTNGYLAPSTLDSRSPCSVSPVHPLGELGG